ncbi:MAG: adenosylcobinamide-GDP ribazoletransferase [Planctomycetota bacterium]|jgi:adenosylcobinamide-GDP ribazoletransferase|nr:adenosylcobinamide-GDP ribazoletransferase [Planctomycetota bacterium]
MRALAAAFRMLSRIPIPAPVTRREDMPASVAWFPFVGCVIGALVAGAFVSASMLWPAGVAAVIAVAFGLLLTGGFHEDAVADAADGFGGGIERERVLAIMRDSRIGTFGVLALWCVLSLRAVTLCALDEAALWLLPAVYAWSRCAAPLLMLGLRPCSERGLASSMGKIATWRIVLAVLIACAAAAAVWHWGDHRAWRIAPAALIATCGWGIYLKRRMGGYSGDLLGTGIQLAEAAALLALLATPPS